MNAQSGRCVTPQDLELSNLTDGSDIFTCDQSVEFFKGTLEIDAELGLSGLVCHETHRNRSLYTPYAADYILRRVPESVQPPI